MYNKSSALGRAFFLFTITNLFKLILMLRKIKMGFEFADLRHLSGDYNVFLKDKTKVKNFIIDRGLSERY